MTDGSESTGAPKNRKVAAADERRARLEARLKANIARRKVQARQRDGKEAAARNPVEN